MKHSVFILLLISSAPVWAQNNTLTPAEKAAGWILLFNGVDKDEHWRSGENGTENNWTVIDSALMCPPDKADMLFTKNKYKNFEYSLEWKLNEGGNSGIFWRVNEPPGWFCSGPEYGILDQENGGDRNAKGYIGDETDLPIKVTASVYDMYVTREDGEVNGTYVNHAGPYDQWNHGVIWADGLNMEHWLNGYKVVDYTIGSDEWWTRFALSKFSRQCSQGLHDRYGQYEDGLLGMQGHGGNLLVWFRNLKVREFETGEQLVSPLISPAPGTYDDSVVVSLEAAITGAKIFYSTDGSEPTPSHAEYTGPFTLDESVAVKAVTYRDNFITSEPVAADYMINGSSAVPRPPRNLKWRTEFPGSGSRIVFSGLGRIEPLAHVTDLLGNSITSSRLNQNNTSLYVPSSNPGLYILKIQGFGYFKTGKLMLYQ